MDEAFQAAAAMGVTVCVASGDNGSTDGVNDGSNHVDFPASSPNVLGLWRNYFAGLKRQDHERDCMERTGAIMKAQPEAGSATSSPCRVGRVGRMSPLPPIQTVGAACPTYLETPIQPPATLR